MKSRAVPLALIVGLLLSTSAAGVERTGFGALFQTDWLAWGHTGDSRLGGFSLGLN